jgi:hypothetical protein
MVSVSSQQAISVLRQKRRYLPPGPKPSDAQLLSTRMDVRHPDGKRKAAPATKTLAEILVGRGAQHRLRLQMAFANCISARTGERVEAIL